ncbi:MAG: hypothetical protein VX392_08230, partial [Verrucomicrobiota bacterium]|nr:hypothetical protein [Verrucomicrobiota bacterium]
MTSLIRRARYMALHWKFLLAPVFITAGMAFAVNWVGGPPEAAVPREAPPITLSDLDGDGDLDMLVESPTRLGQVDDVSVDVFTNDGDRMAPLAVGLSKRELESGLGDLLPGYARWLAGEGSEEAMYSDNLAGVAPLPPLPLGMQAAAPERFDTKPGTLGDDYPEIRTLTMNFTALAKRVAEANLEPDETVRRHRLLSLQKMGAPGEAAKPSPSGPRPLGGDFEPGVRDDFLGVIDNHTAIPADTHGAVGPEHLMVALNTEIAIQTREGELLSKVGLGDFWAGFSHGFVFDPKVVYDHLA